MNTSDYIDEEQGGWDGYFVDDCFKIMLGSSNNPLVCKHLAVMMMIKMMRTRKRNILMKNLTIQTSSVFKHRNNRFEHWEHLNSSSSTIVIIFMFFWSVTLLVQRCPRKYTMVTAA